MSFVKTKSGIRHAIPHKGLSDVAEIYGVIDSDREHNFVVRKHTDGSVSLTEFRRAYSVAKGREIWDVVHYKRIGGTYELN